MNKERSIETLSLDGGALCFHFINTVNAWRGQHPQHEYLGSYEELLKWCRKVDMFPEKNRRALKERAARHPADAEKALQKIKDARETLYHFFSAIALDDGRSVDAGVLERFNRLMKEALSRLAFIRTAGGITQGWKENGTDLLAPLWIALKSAYDLLVQEDHSRIKECMACGWIFLDQTKNNKRRWCSPLTCGSIEKSRKYYRKKKAMQ